METTLQFVRATDLAAHEAPRIVSLDGLFKRTLSMGQGNGDSEVFQLESKLLDLIQAHPNVLDYLTTDYKLEVIRSWGYEVELLND